MDRSEIPREVKEETKNGGSGDKKDAEPAPFFTWFHDFLVFFLKARCQRKPGLPGRIHLISALTSLDVKLVKIRTTRLGLNCDVRDENPAYYVLLLFVFLQGFSTELAF